MTERKYTKDEKRVAKAKFYTLLARYLGKRTQWKSGGDYIVDARRCIPTELAREATLCPTIRSLNPVDWLQRCRRLL